MPNSLSFLQIAALILPLPLIGSMWWCFQRFTRRFGYPRGYLLGFVVYWIGWCLLIPWLLLGGFGDLFTPFPPITALDWKTHLLLWGPSIFPLAFMFLPRVRKANPAILLASAALGIAIGVTEEILWRGVYLRLFPDNAVPGVLYPTIMFALWHLCPQSVVANKLPGGRAAFVIYAFFLGLAYALVTVQTGSIGWTSIGHSLHDSLGLAGFTYAVWLAPKQAAQRPVT